MNRSYYYELLNGSPNGRKIAYTNVDKITEDNIVKVVGNAIGIHNRNKQFIKYLWDYKNGDQPIRYRDVSQSARSDIRNVVVENRAWEIVQFKNGQTTGEPSQIVSLKKEDNVNKGVDELNTYIKAAHKQVADIDSGEYTSAVGFGYEAVQIRHGKKVPFAVMSCDPMTTFIIYSSHTGEPMLAVQELEDENNQRYLLCFDETYEYRIQNSRLLALDFDGDGQEVFKRLHIFGGIPIVEKRNNQSRISDIELVIDMLDAINNIQSNRIDAIQGYVQSWIKFVNCDVDEDSFQKMKMMGALSVKSNNGSDNKADVDIISQELNQTQTEVAKEDIWDSILSIEAIPNKSNGSDGGSTQGAVELRSGWDFSKQRARMKDAYIEQAEMRLTQIILNVIHAELGNNVCPIDELDFKVQITHSPTDNMVAKTTALQVLLQAGIHPLVAFTTCGLWSDAEKVFMLSKPYLDNLYKTIDDAIAEQGLEEQKAKAQQMLNDMGMNENNRQKQMIAQLTDD